MTKIPRIIQKKYISDLSNNNNNNNNKFSAQITLFGVFFGQFSQNLISQKLQKNENSPKNPKQ
jgi:hypothetical membrane protein